MTAVRCAGCTRRIGVSPSATPLRNKVYCASWCLHDAPVLSQDETRAALMTELSREGRTDGYIADLFGVGRSRVQQIVSARRA